MVTHEQITAFIAPNKFADLILDSGYSLPSNYRQNGIFLNNGNNLVYIQNDGNCDIGAYIEDKAKTASIILVPDTFSFQYNPEVPFKLVSHGQTPDYQINRLNQNTNFRGWKKTNEEIEVGGITTTYKKIADFINKSNNTSFDSIYNDFEDFDHELEKLLKPFENVLPLDSAWKEHKEKQNEDLWQKRLNLRNHLS